ncbi:MAG: hypothetical protein GTO18_00470 [Anaerolineales bacterium]|nr:hypothetical protein [Anaerolineales bacterium]
MINSGSRLKFRYVRQIAIIPVLILGIISCSLSAEPDRPPGDSELYTATASLGVDDATPTVFIEPSVTPYVSPSATPNPPTAITHPTSTQTGMVDPSAAALFLRDRSTVSTPRAASGPTSILFVSKRDGVADIYRMNEDGTEQVRLNHNGRNNESPAWAPDGQKIAFLSHEVDATASKSTSRLFVMNSDGTGSIDITPFLDQSFESLNWSPDGQRIAFVANPSPADEAFAGRNIHVVNRDGSGLTQITNMEPGSVGCWSPTWSPDGAKLVFICRALMGVGIMVSDVDRSDQWYIEYGQVNRIFWLPSGVHVGFAGGVCWSVGILTAEFLLSHGASGEGPWPCLDQDFEALGVEMTSPYGVAWSPLVDTLFAVLTTDNFQIVDLAAFEVSVFHYGSNRLNDSPSWSPRGDRVVFAADDGTDTEIYVLSLESNEVVQLTDNEVDDYMPAWQP